MFSVLNCMKLFIKSLILYQIFKFQAWKWGQEKNAYVYFNQINMGEKKKRIILQT